MRRIRNGAAAAAAMLALGALELAAQTSERYVLSGGEVGVYNLAGELTIEGGSGSAVEVSVARGGEDARRLQVETGRIDGRETLRIRYPEDRIVYSRLGGGSRTQLRVRRDGTFYGEGRGGGSSVTISGSGRGLDAYADLRVRVPAGQRIAVHLGVGRVHVANVDGDLVVDVGAAAIESQKTRGRLRLDTGSGSVRVSDAEGEVEVDTGSGSVQVHGIRGPRLLVDTGSGSVTGEGIAVRELEVDTGSGRIRLADVRAEDAVLDTGSGAVELGLLGEVRRLAIDTGSGSVTLTVPATLGAEVEVDTGSGGIDVDLPLYLVERRRTYLLGRLGDGRGSVRIDTGSGGVRIRGS